MKISAGHRPWPVPSQAWIMRQTWNDLLFMHWPVDPKSLARFIPAPLRLDVIENRAWLGIVPFRMTDVGLRGAPGVSFAELNVRTYVTDGKKPGVWFFSLDAENILAVQAARIWYRLPYFYAKMTARPEGGSIVYRSSRRKGSAEFAARYEPVSDAFTAAPGTLEHWLTERYCLYSTDGKSLFRADIHHEPWRLQQASAAVEKNSMAQFLGPDLAGKPLLHFSKKQPVIVWNLRRWVP